MPSVSGTCGMINVAPGVINGKGAPSVNFKGLPGQGYVDNSTNPPTLYFYNGRTWIAPSGSGGAGNFSSVTTTGNVVGGTGLTATTGNITASAAGAGLLLNSPTATGAAASPLVLNGRSGQAIFSSVSIAAAADLTLTITNSAITGAATQVIYSLSGTTSGSALSIKSVTNSAGSSAIVVTNGTGATTSVSDITLTFLVLN